MPRIKASFVASGLAHAAVLGVAVFGLPMPSSLEAPPPEPLPVDLVSLEEFTRLQQGEREAPKDRPAAVEAPEAPEPVEEPAEKPAEKQVESQPAPSPEPAPAPAPAPAPEPASTPAPEPQPEPAEMAEPEPEAPPVPEFKPVEPPKPVPRKREVAEPEPQTQPRPVRRQESESRFDADRVAALLNKIPEAPQGPQETSNTAEQPGFGLDRGNDNALSMDEISYLRSQISRCWNPPVGVVNAENLTVDIYFELNQDGSLSGAPQVARAPSGQLGQIAAESARRAVELCEPYELPPQKYEHWQAIQLTFDPKFMFGG